MNIFKRAAKKVRKAAKKAVGTISHGLSQIDPSYSQGFIGRYTAPIAKPAIASATMVLTGGAAALVRPDLVKPAIQGFKIGAAIGTGVKAGGAIGAAEAGASIVSASYTPVTSTESGATIGEGGSTGEPSQVARGAKVNGLPIVLIGGIGLLVYLLTGNRKRG